MCDNCLSIHGNDIIRPCDSLLNGHTLVVSSIAVLHAEVKELDIEIDVGQNQLSSMNKDKLSQ